MRVTGLLTKVPLLADTYELATCRLNVVGTQGEDMDTPLVMFRVGYMSSYGGVGPISGGGSHVEDHGEGGEMWNFRKEGGHCYGYVMTTHFAGLNLDRISPDSTWKPNDELDGVDVVFFATKPSVGQVVVGWYSGATVYHKKYRTRPGGKTKGDRAKLHYLCQVDAGKALLLPEDKRTFNVPYGPSAGKGFPGQSNVWYPPADNPEADEFVGRLRQYIVSNSGLLIARGYKVKKRGVGWTSNPDKDLLTRIEQAAVSATAKHFETAGYEISSVEKDNRGWDLEARKAKELLLLEVKGHIGNVVQFELTPNEYSQLRTHNKNYRICLVRNALENADVEIFSASENEGEWSLRRSDGRVIVKLLERIGARAFESDRN